MFFPNVILVHTVLSIGSVWILVSKINIVSAKPLHKSSSSTVSSPSQLQDAISKEKNYLDLLSKHDWCAYLHQYPDLFGKLRSSTNTAKHFLARGEQEHRSYPISVIPALEGPSKLPNKYSINSVFSNPAYSVPSIFSPPLKKLSKLLSTGQQRNPLTLILYHIDYFDSRNSRHSLEVLLNNLHIFLSSLDATATKDVFVWLNIVGNEEENVLYGYMRKHFPALLDNSEQIGIVSWPLSYQKVYYWYLYMKSLQMVDTLEETVKQRIEHVLCMHHAEIRGPFRPNPLDISPPNSPPNSLPHSPTNKATQAKDPSGGRHWLDAYLDIFSSSSKLGMIALPSPIPPNTLPNTNTNANTITKSNTKKEVAITVNYPVNPHFIFFKASMIPILLHEYSSCVISPPLFNKLYPRNSSTATTSITMNKKSTGNTAKNYGNVIDWYSEGLKYLVQSAGYEVKVLYPAAVLPAADSPSLVQQWNQLFNNCPFLFPTAAYNTIPTFLPWGYDYFQQLTLLSDDWKATGRGERERIDCAEENRRLMYDLLCAYKQQCKDEDAIIAPETLQGGILYDLYKQFALEIASKPTKTALLSVPEPSQATSRSTSTNSPIDSKADPIQQNNNDNDNVCLLIRTAHMHFSSPISSSPLPNPKPTDTFDNTTGVFAKDMATGLSDLLASLLRQTDRHWIAYVFYTDSIPVGIPTDLVQLISRYEDDRIQYLHVPHTYRPPFTDIDAAYTPTDYILTSLLQASTNTQHSLHPTLHSTASTCTWVSVTNADNVYGSEVIARVRQPPIAAYATASTTSSLRGNNNNPSTISRRSAADMILTPLDSRNFADQDNVRRQVKKSWKQYCLGILSLSALNEITYTTQPRPVLGKVDLASVFLSTKKLATEYITFGNFTHPKKYPCIGCQDGYFTEYLVSHRLWSYHRLPIDGLKSIIFHGLSPTWCLASGYIWFDHPQRNRVKCYSPAQLRNMRQWDEKHRMLLSALPSDGASISGNSMKGYYLFDWDLFDRTKKEFQTDVCLRFSKSGFLNELQYQHLFT